MKKTRLIALTIGAMAALAALPSLALASPLNDQLPMIMLGGMLVNKESIASTFIALKTIFNSAFGTTETTWQKIAMLVPSTTGQNDYAWLSKFPRMRKWIGDKNIKALEAASNVRRKLATERGKR